MEYVSHPLIREESIEKRAYQEKILAEVSSRNSLVVLPTGLGKTMIAAMLVAHKLSSKGGKVLFMAPTRPLVIQHRETFTKVLDIDQDKMMLFTGAIPPTRRNEGYRDATIVLATPQVIENDIISGRLDLSDFSLMIIDEAHRAIGDYAYVFISKRYNEKNPAGTILAITASPGYDKKKVSLIVENLGIERVHIENEESPDVSPYVHEIEMEWVRLDFPEGLENARRMLRSVYDEKIDVLLRSKLISKPKQYINRKDIIAIGEKLRHSLGTGKTPQGNYFTLIKAQAAALKLSHALEQLETQGADALIAYFDRVKKQKSRTSKELLSEGRIIRALREVSRCETPHPKMEKLKGILEGLRSGQNAIVFSQYRDTTQRITENLSEMDGIRPARFVGQSSRDEDEGLSQKEQKRILEEFRSGAYNVLVATSVAEEGLDIPNVDLVIFFEPIPSEIRTIQRRGRTGRRRTGKVIILSMKGTVDEAYYKVAIEKEKRMQKVMTQMDGKEKKEKGQSNLDNFIGERPKVICDSRENPQIIKLLSQRVEIEVRSLDVGDYILSERTGIERKSTSDFLRSLFENKLFDQVKSLSSTFERAYVMIEGEDLLSRQQTHANSIRSAMISIMLDFNVGLISTKDIIESVEYIYQMARREQSGSKGLPRLRGDKRVMNQEQNMIYLVEGLPNVSSTLARRLLEHFGNVEGIMSASKEELKQVDGVGDKIAEKIRELVSSPYLKK
ncbi:MAG: DEAD/DEAH box helicase family protein [Candidatus Methanofastidiosa archaeon]|nr:DEAD/DEAH box helicase family protein [Candidatus Methanofastidiosa archaeon]